jgi:hypothetical protein
MSPKVRLFVAFAWAVGVMCLAPLDYWAPLLAISLFCAGALTKWSGKSWVAPLLGIVTVIYCLQDMWRRGDHGSVVTFAAFLAAFLVVLLHLVAPLIRSSSSTATRSTHERRCSIEKSVPTLAATTPRRSTR